jgi:nucleoside-diphosphate-sugar epimerase
MPVLLAVGLGYSAKALARRLHARGWRIIGTSRSGEGVRAIDAMGYDGVAFDGTAPSPALARAMSEATHLLVSASPGPDGDPLLARHAGDLRAAKLQWVGYLSTIGVYGNHDGKWVDEETPPAPTSQRGQARVEAERAWAAFSEETSVPLGIFRLSGIYGPGRGPLEKLRRRESRAVIKPGQVFNRIHVEDIATALEAAISCSGERPGPRVYNVTDDEPAPPQDVLDFAADLIGVPHPTRVPFEQADMSAMARSFYSDNKRTANARMKAELRVKLAYPTYREGIRALAASA